MSPQCQHLSILIIESGRSDLPSLLRTTKSREIRQNYGEFGPPLVESGITETAFAAKFLDRHPGFGLLQKSDDLFFAVSACLHARHSPYIDGLLYFYLVRQAGGRSVSLTYPVALAIIRQEVRLQPISDHHPG